MKRKFHKRTRLVPLRTRRQAADAEVLRRPHPESNLTLDEANELARQIDQLLERHSRVSAYAQVERATTRREHERLMSIYGPALQRFITLHADDPAEGVVLPVGELYVEQWPAQLHVEDEEAALHWCREHSDDSINVTISLPGNYEPMLTKFMKRELPMYLHDETVFSRTVNPRRLLADWRYMEFDEIPAGCRLEEAKVRVFVSPHEPNRARKGGDDDA